MDIETFKIRTARLYRKHRSIYKVGEILGVRSTTVAQRLRSIGVKMQGPKGRVPPRRVRKLTSERAKKAIGQKAYSWKGGISRSYAKKIISKERCSKCKTKEKLEIHHLDRNKQNNSLTNLTVLCSTCHKRVHVKLRRRDGYRKETSKIRRRC